MGTGKSLTNGPKLDLRIPYHSYACFFAYLVCWTIRIGGGDMDSLKINQFLDHLILERRLSEHTHRNYRGSLLRFQEWVGKEISRSSLLSTNQEIARSYLIEIQSNLSRKTLANHVSALRSFFQFCQVRGWTSSNSFQELVCSQPVKDTPKFLTESQAESF